MWAHRNAASCRQTARSCIMASRTTLSPSQLDSPLFTFFTLLEGVLGAALGLEMANIEELLDLDDSFDEVIATRVGGDRCIDFALSRPSTFARARLHSASPCQTR